MLLGTRVIVMSSRPGRVILDRRIELPEDRECGDRDPPVIAIAEFQAIRKEAHTSDRRRARLTR